MQLNYHLSPLEWILLAGLLLPAISLIVFYIRIYAKVNAWKPDPEPGPENGKKPVSVILSGKNQYEALKKNLTFWLEQKYPDFEVVVVHESTDEDVSSLLKEFARHYKNLTIVNANQSINFFGEQKFSLSIGAKSARNELIIMTHPKFRPASESCIDRIQAAFRENTEIVIGHAVFSEKENPACSFALFQMMEDTLQYTGFALRGKSFAGRQSLIAYRKSSFLEHQGYSDSYALDCEGFDSFRKRIPDPSAIRVQLAPGSEVKYTGTLSFKKMLEQKRQYRTALAASPRGIRNEITAYWIMDFLYRVFFFGSVFHFFARSLAGMPESFPLWAGLSALAIIGKYAVQAAIFQKAGKSTGYGTCWFALPLYDILSLSLHLALIPRRKRGR